MYQSILITNQNEVGTNYSLTWDDEFNVTITHNFEDGYVAVLLDKEDHLVIYPMIMRSRELIIGFKEELSADKFFRVNLFNSLETSSDPTENIGEYYSGPEENILMFCKSLNISDDRLASVSPVKVEKYQRIVDDAIDGYICEYYFTPLTVYNQVQPNGSIRKVFPGKIRFLAIQWTAGLLLQSEFQNMEPNMHEAGVRFVEEAKKEMQQIVDFSTRIPGQRRKHPSPTMPPNLAPSKTNEFIL